MPTDIRELLDDALGAPRSSRGFEDIWRRRRSLRIQRLLAFGVGAVVLVALVGSAVTWPGQQEQKLPVAGDGSPTGTHGDQTAIKVGGHPIAVAVGEGGVWVAKYEKTGGRADYSIVRIDPVTNEIVAAIAVDGRPEDLIASGGTVWVILSRYPDEGGLLVAIDPLTDEASTGSVDFVARPTRLAVGGGSVWVAVEGGEVLRVDPQEREVVAEFQIGEGAVVASDGNQVWAANTRGDISRIDLRTNHTVGPTVRAGWNVIDIAVTADAIWATQTTPDEEFRVLRIDPRSQELAGEPILVDLNQGPLAVGEGGVWMLQYAIDNENLDRDGNILRIDPGTNEVDELEGTGVGSVGLAVGEGSLWVAKVAQGEVYRINPNAQGQPLP